MGINIVDRERIRVLETHSSLSFVALMVGLLAGYRQLLWGGVILLVLPMVSITLASRLARGWLWFSAILSRVNNTLVLTILFYCFLTPIALIYRVFHKDPLKLDLDAEGSFYSDRNHTYGQGDFNKMW